MDGKGISPELRKAAEHFESMYQTAYDIRNIRARLDTHQLEMQVEWNGLPDETDNTWELAEQMIQDLPGIMEDFFHTSGKRTLKRRALEQFNLSITT